MKEEIYLTHSPKSVDASILASLLEGVLDGEKHTDRHQQGWLTRGYNEMKFTRFLRKIFCE